jgi:hypothetical protein
MIPHDVSVVVDSAVHPMHWTDEARVRKPDTHTTAMATRQKIHFTHIEQGFSRSHIHTKRITHQ